MQPDFISLFRKGIQFGALRKIELKWCTPFEVSTGFPGHIRRYEGQASAPEHAYLLKCMLYRLIKFECVN